MPKDKKKKRSGRSSRNHNSLPPSQLIIPSSDYSANCSDDFDFDDYITNNNIIVEGGSGGCKEYICKFIHILSILCYFCSPFIVMLEIYGLKIAPILGFGLFLFKIFVLDLILFNMGRKKNQEDWPKTFDLTAAVVFGLSAIFTYTFPRTDIQQFQSMFGIHRFSFGSLTLLIAITWFSLFSILIMIYVLIRIFNSLQSNIIMTTNKKSNHKNHFKINKLLEMEI